MIREFGTFRPLSPSLIGDPQSPGQASPTKDSDGRLAPQERRIKLLAALCEKGLFKAVAALEKEQPTNDLKYRSWELVRHGRAAEVVGTVLGPDGKPIRYNGFEPYFLGLPAEKIVKREIELGHHLAAELKLEHPKGRTIELNQQEREVIKALRGEEISHSHIIQVLKDLDCVFQVVHNRAKGGLIWEGIRFRDHTHDIVESSQPYEPVVKNTVVHVENAEDRNALILLGEIGIIGHPALREIVEGIPFRFEEEPKPVIVVDEATHRRLNAAVHTGEKGPPDELA